MLTRHLTNPLRQMQALLLLALLLGGGGIVYGWRHMAIELAALALLALHPENLGRFVREQSPFLVALVGLTVALPLLQALPLPPAWWQALPGRDLVTEAYGAVAINPDSWFSFSLDPMRSLLACCATLVPLSLIVTGAQLPQTGRIELAWTLVAIGGLALLLGAVQLSSGNTVGMMQDMTPHDDTFYALFSNRNSTGIFFVTLALVLAALPWPRTTAGLAIYCTGMALALLAVLLTQSRTSIALAVFVPLFTGWRLIDRKLRQPGPGPAPGMPGSSRRALAVLVLVALFGAAVGLSLTTQGRLAVAAERFEKLDADRLEMWDDAYYVAGRYWPLGAGTGAFDDVFQVDESLEYVSPARAGRAHNDYLELAVELGLPGLLVLACWWVWIGLACYRRRRDPDRWLARAAFLSFVVIALQASFDYPLRNHAMLAVAGLLVVLLLPPRPRAEPAA